MHFARANVDNFYFAFLATRKKKIFSECVGLVKDYCGATLVVVRSVKRRAAALIKDFHFGARTRPPLCGPFCITHNRGRKSKHPPCGRCFDDFQSIEPHSPQSCVALTGKLYYRRIEPQYLEHAQKPSATRRGPQARECRRCRWQQPSARGLGGGRNEGDR